MNKELLIEAIIEYRETGKELMFQLDNKFGLDISKPEEYLKLVSISGYGIPRNNELSKEWKYAFHGMECGFYHQKNKQSVEVKLINPPNFGVIESWFLLSFLKSTVTYKYLAESLDWQSLEKMLVKLYQSNEIEEIKE